MNKEELLGALEETVPPLRGKLRVDRVWYRKAENKAYVSFFSDELVAGADFLALERRLRELLPGVAIALRIASPSLAEDFIAHIDNYLPVLNGFLRRQSPALSTWIHDVGWTVENGRILLTCPDDISLQYFKRNHLDEKLAQAVWDIFRLKLNVALTVCGQREEWVREMRKELPFPLSVDSTENGGTNESGVPAAGDSANPQAQFRRADTGHGLRLRERSRAI